jgi:ATPase subunit of ABC transporter with duplicated ATPase domains
MEESAFLHLLLFSAQEEMHHVNGFLLIDEPTNHLDMNGRRIVSEYLRSKCGFILVSHDRAFLDNCTDHILSINRTNIEIQKGNFSSWWNNKQLRDNLEIARNDALKKEIKRLETSARRVSNWSDRVERSKKGERLSGIKPDKGYIGHKSAKMMKRSKVIESRVQTDIEEKSALLKNIETASSLLPEVCANQPICTSGMSRSTTLMSYPECRSKICSDTIGRLSYLLNMTALFVITLQQKRYCCKNSNCTMNFPMLPVVLLQKIFV